MDDQTKICHIPVALAVTELATVISSTSKCNGEFMDTIRLLLLLKLHPVQTVWIILFQAVSFHRIEDS